jgi:predicted dinucleotide-binding enzyme
MIADPGVADRRNRNEIMKIAIIGTGNVGSALGGSFARAGHAVTFAARDTARAAEVAAAAGGTSATVVEAAAGADVIVLAIPYAAAADVASEIAAVAAGKVVIDATNPVNATYSGLVTDGGPSGAERTAAAIGGASVVKAFNTLFAGVQSDPGVHGTTLDALYATDDEAAGAAVAELATSIGFRPVRVGPLAAASELEALAWLNIRLQLVSGGAWQTSYVLVAPPAAAIAA